MSSGNASFGRPSRRTPAALVECPGGIKHRETLFGRGLYSLFACRLGFGGKSELMVKPARVVLGIGEAEGVLDRAGELERFLAHPLRLLRISQLPKGQRQIAAMRYPGILPDVRRPQSRAFTIVVVRKGLFILGERADEIAAVKQRQAQ